MKELRQVHIDRVGSIKKITLNAPATSNSLTASTVEELLGHVRESYADGTDTLIIAGAGSNFCSGLDLTGLEEAHDSDLFLRLIRIELLLQAIHMASFDTIACAKGAAYGAGADLFASCRFRLVDPRARFLMPGLQFGIALGTRRFSALVGETTAYEILAAGVPFDSAIAYKIGLASQIEQEENWQAIIEQRHRSRLVTGRSLARLSRLTRHDSSADDMFALVESACEPGLVDRIRIYAEAVRTRRNVRQT